MLLNILIVTINIIIRQQLRLSSSFSISISVMNHKLVLIVLSLNVNKNNVKAMNWLFNNISLSSCNFMSYTYTWSHNVLQLMQVLRDQFSLSHSSERCPGISQMTANEGSIPGSVPWIICKEGCCTVSLSPPHPQIPPAPTSTPVRRSHIPCVSGVLSVSAFSH